MPELIHNTQQDFWRPPAAMLARESVTRDAIPTMAETCARCGTEFLLGSRFCHTCGGRRPDAITSTAKADAAAIARLWERAVVRTHSALAAIPWGRMWNKIKPAAWVHSLHFQLHLQEIRTWVGLPTASLIAFSIGLGCVAGALLVGLFTAKTLVDWQAIQFYRVEWLLAATASFVAAILLKNPSSN